MPEHEATFAVGSHGDAARVILILQIVGNERMILVGTAG
jgi:hypothetical protein